jgi:[ribosomal protein S5]-alanine N-acetyltransferase
MNKGYKDIFINTRTLITRRLLLREFTLLDEMEVFKYGSDALTLKYLIWDGLKDIEETRRTIINHYSRPGIFAIALEENNKCLGCIDLRLETQYEKASFGYILERSYWNQGYMSEALLRVLRFCFEDLGLNRVEATYYAGNEGSGRVMEKCGMKKEGVGIKEVKIKGVYQDVVHMGIISEQWQNIRLL